MATTNRNTMRRLQQYISSYEATKGRKPSPQLVQAFVEADLAAQYSRFGQEQERVSLQKSREEDARIRRAEIAAQKQAATLSGGVQLATTGIMGYDVYKRATAPKTPTSTTSGVPAEKPEGVVSKAVRAFKKTPTEEQAGQAFDPETGEYTDTYMEGEGGTKIVPEGVRGSSGLEIPAYTPGSLTSSVSTLSGPTAASAPQLTGLELGSFSGATAAPASASPYALEADLGIFSTGGGAGTAGATSAPTAGAAGAEAGAGAGAGAYLGSAGAGYAAGSIVGKTFAKSETLTDITPWGGEKTEGAIAGAAAGGAAAGLLAGAGWGAAGGPVGIAIGAIAGAVGGGSIICTELYYQGYLSKRVLILDGEHRLKNIDNDTYNGYVKWAKYIVSAMKKSKTVTKIVAPIGRAWAYEMAHRMDSRIPGSVFGKVLMKIGVPICRLIGKIGRRF